MLGSAHHLGFTQFLSDNIRAYRPSLIYGEQLQAQLLLLVGLVQLELLLPLWGRADEL